MTRIAPQQAYTVLGVTPEDDFATIRKAWVRLVKANHPDALGGDIDTATRRLSRINDAYDSLRWHNPQKLRIHQAREAQRRQEARATRTRQVDALRAGRPTPDTPPPPSQGDVGVAKTPNRQAPPLAALQGAGNRLAEQARRKYGEVQEICETATQAVMIRSA
ncbi:J domain-containing protein [Antarctobacter heliothermus]|uniref:DnaJ domain-containing protein n=1 Tax=Antarctobacter heliothermus TaxID=74033 RepID=A0A239DNB7_9RHOB|nr:J domain-containing protein [Antarctobacter heliothermus]SNS33950.1 DnaJ domain-containing protein [Antarctobacter heliothermus]